MANADMRVWLSCNVELILLAEVLAETGREYLIYSLLLSSGKLDFMSQMPFSSSISPYQKKTCKPLCFSELPDCEGDKWGKAGFSPC